MDIKPIKIVSAEQNLVNTKLAIDYYHLGATNPSSANEVFWAKMAKMFRITMPEVKRMRCANCSYYDNTPEMFKQMEAIPQNEFDIYDVQAQRGYCHRLEFICHTSRLCSVWEKKPFIGE